MQSGTYIGAHLRPHNKRDEGRSSVKMYHGVEARVSELSLWNWSNCQETKKNYSCISAEQLTVSQLHVKPKVCFFPHTPILCPLSKV